MTLRMIRNPLLGVMAIILAFSSLSAATARGQRYDGQKVVICTGEILVTVTIDENGQPVKHTHVCPDYALLLAAVLIPAGPVILEQLSAIRLPRVFDAGQAEQQIRIRPRARAPPVS